MKIVARQSSAHQSRLRQGDHLAGADVQQGRDRGSSEGVKLTVLCLSTARRDSYATSAPHSAMQAADEISSAVLRRRPVRVITDAQVQDVRDCQR